MASYELLADTMSSLHPDPIAKLKKKTKRLRRFGRNGKSTNTNSQGQGGDVGDDDDEEDDIDPYALTVLSPKDGVPLPLVLKHAELAVVDLKILVKHSSLPGDRKELLVELLEKFHVGAKATTRKLQFLQARANGCVDGLVIRNVYLIAELDRLEEQQQRWVLKDGSGNSGDGERGSIVGSVAAMWDRVWDLFTGEHELQILASEQKLQFLYQRTMEDARKHIRDLIVQAQDVLQSLDALDQAMASIHETTTQEKRAQSSGHEEILSLLWSRLGGNRLQRSFFRDNLRLLKDIGLQRKVAVGQIQSALLKLTEFEAEIGILRERVVDATVDITVDPGEGPHTVTAPSPNTGTPGQYDDNESMSGDAMPTDRALPGVSGMGASTLRSHILEINRATRRMKERSFLADTVLKSEQADQIPAGAKPDDASSP
ncbi:hypothetical protein BGX28_004302 [Mortierella sp. GBA30]|nr:hypothetical protein BGX28_004302 [Mortierella sp. GBA30]